MRNDELDKWMALESRRRYWRKVGWGFLTGVLAVIATILILAFCSSCAGSKQEWDDVRGMPQTTLAEIDAKRAAIQELLKRQDEENSWWNLADMAGAIAGGFIPGVGLALAAARKARQMSLGLDMTVDHLKEATNLMPELDRDKFIERMKVKQEAAGVRGVIQPKVQKARGKV